MADLALRLLFSAVLALTVAAVAVHALVSVLVVTGAFP